LAPTAIGVTPAVFSLAMSASSSGMVVGVEVMPALVKRSLL